MYNLLYFSIFPSRFSVIFLWRICARKRRSKIRIRLLHCQSVNVSLYLPFLPISSILLFFSSFRFLCLTSVFFLRVLQSGRFGVPFSFLGSGPVGDDDLWYHHIGEFSPFFFVFVLRPPPPWGLPAGSETLPVGSEALSAGPEALSAGSETLLACSTPSQLDSRRSQLVPRLT